MCAVSARRSLRRIAEGDIQHLHRHPTVPAADEVGAIFAWPGRKGHLVLLVGCSCSGAIHLHDRMARSLAISGWLVASVNSAVAGQSNDVILLLVLAKAEPGCIWCIHPPAPPASTDLHCHWRRKGAIRLSCDQGWPRDTINQSLQRFARSEAAKMTTSRSRDYPSRYPAFGPTPGARRSGSRSAQMATSRQAWRAQC